MHLCDGDLKKGRGNPLRRLIGRETRHVGQTESTAAHCALRIEYRVELIGQFGDVRRATMSPIAAMTTSAHVDGSDTIRTDTQRKLGRDPLVGKLLNFGPFTA